MTEFSAFSSANYNVTEWIDEILRERNEEETMDSYLATLIMKLHVVSQEYSDQLEGGSTPPPFPLVLINSQV
jgi:hypothetical protein